MTGTTACRDCAGHGWRQDTTLIGFVEDQCQTCGGTGLVSPPDPSSPAGSHVDRTGGRPRT